MSDTDLTSADFIQITIEADGRKLWVDVDGQNRFRAYRIKYLAIADRRPRGSVFRVHYMTTEMIPHVYCRIFAAPNAEAIEPANCTGACRSRGCNCGHETGYTRDGKAFARCVPGCSCLLPCTDSPTVKQETKP
jgi:hypothetical protein